MKKMLKKWAAAVCCRSVITLAVILLASLAPAQITSQLWGVSGEAWNTNGLLRDFTMDVGYMGGHAEIPDWPVWTNVTDLGAIPDDNVSDVNALRAAISNCPPYHAIFLPNGRYVIDEAIDVTSDNIVIRGESRLGTILYFPKHMNEINRTLTASDPFIVFSGGTNRGIENLSMVLRDEQKGTGYVNRHLPKQNDPHWFYNGENPLLFSGSEKNSWARNLYIKNANHAISISNGGTRNITIMNIVLDQFIGRRSAYDNTDGHMGIQVADAATHCLIHNILITQNYVHDICPMGTQDSVFSRISGPGVKLDHHANGNTRNLYTEVDYGDFSGYGEDYNNGSETYWGLNGTNDASYLPTDRPCVFVGIKTGEPTDIGATWHHETLDPNLLEPANLYLAQLAYHSKDAPADMTLTLPPATAPYRLLAVDDAHVYRFDEDANYGLSTSVAIGGTRPAFMKFDLSDLGITNAACAKLKIKSGGTSHTPLGLQIWDVSDDSWNERTLCYSNRPAAGAVILSSNLYNSGWIELDLTSYVNSELAGDQIVSISLTTGAVGGNKDATIWFPSAEGGNAAELVIHTNASTVAPPATPTGLVATPSDNQAFLDWNDNTEDDFASYNVYCTLTPGSNYVIDAMGLITSDYDGSWVTNGTTYTYLVKAVDTAGTESLEGMETSVTPSAALTGYALWAAGWGTNDIGAATNDFDFDDLNNLYEYGLDGDPTVAGLGGGTWPMFLKSGSSFIYVHPKRSDDTNLIYRVETTTNLVSGAWTNEGYIVTGTNVIGETLDFVTNEVDTVENERFIRLKIEH